MNLATNYLHRGEPENEPAVNLKMNLYERIRNELEKVTSDYVFPADIRRNIEKDIGKTKKSTWSVNLKKASRATGFRIVAGAFGKNRSKLVRIEPARFAPEVRAEVQREPHENLTNLIRSEEVFIEANNDEIDLMEADGLIVVSKNGLTLTWEAMKGREKEIGHIITRIHPDLKVGVKRGYRDPKRVKKAILKITDREEA